MNFDLTVAINWALQVQAAAQVGEGNNPQYNPPNGYTVLTPIFGNDLATDKKGAAIADYVPYGYVARNGASVVIAIRGTDNVFEWVQDAKFLMQKCPIANSAGNTEDGFSDVYMSMRVQPDPNAQTIAQYMSGALQPGDAVVVCGHSVGAALATLCAYDLALNVKPGNLASFTYASPNVGDQTFADSYGTTVPVAWRIVNPFDIVTHVPTRIGLGYQTVGQTEEFNPLGKVRFGIACFHHLTTYLHLMTTQAGWANPIPLDPECVYRPFLGI